MSTIVPRLPTSCAALLLVAAAPLDQARVGYVIDGDTFRLESGERIHIAGIDTPPPSSSDAVAPLEP
jgi:endonuclease YncB( thermonuclease family)